MKNPLKKQQNTNGTMLLMLCIFCFVSAKSQISYYSDDFEDNDLSSGMVWSGTTSAFAATSTSPLNGSYSMGTNTANTPRTIYKQYGTSTNLSTANLTWSFTFITTTTSVTDLSSASTHASLAAGTNSWRYWLAASAASSGCNGYYIAQDGGRINFVRTNGSNEKYSPFGFNISANTKYAVRVTRSTGNLWKLYVDANTDNATTQQGSTNEGTYFNSGNANIFTKFEVNTVSTANIFKFDNVYLGVPSLSATALTNGLTSTVLSEGATNQAVVGFAFTATGSAGIVTNINIPNTNSNSAGTFSNGKLVMSTDNDFSTTSDNTTITGQVQLQSSYVQIYNTNFTVTPGTSVNLFLVFDLQSPFGGSAPSTMQFSMSQAGITSDISVNSFSFSTVTYLLSKVYSWNGNTSSDWNTASNWTYNGNNASSVPGSSAMATIGVSSFSNQPLVGANASIGSIYFGSRKEGTLTVSTGATLTVTASINVNNDSNSDVNATLTGAGAISVGSLNIGGQNVTPNPGTRTTSLTSTITTLNVTGNVILNSIVSTSARINNAIMYLQSGTMSIAGAIQSINDNAVNTSTFQMNSGAGSATLNLTGTTPFSLSSTGTNTLSFAGTSTTVNYNGGVQSVYAGSYTNLKISGTGNKTSSGAITVAGALILADRKLSIGSNTLTLNGTFSGSASASLTGSSTSNITIGGTGALGTLYFDQTTDQTTNNIATLTINRTVSGTATFGNNLNISSLLQLTSGAVTLAANDTVTMRSTSTVNTAMIGTLGSGASIAYGTNAAFRIERFIPRNTSNSGLGVKAYRDIAPCVNSGSSTIFTNWQEAGVNTNGYGTQITGTAGVAGSVDPVTGFDLTNSGNKSLSSFNVANGAGAWYTYTSTKADTLSAFKGYRVLIRGNRTNNLGVDVANMTSTATLRSTGKIVTGTVTYNTSGVTAGGSTNTNIKLSAAGDGYTIVANPYAAPVDWHTVYGRSSNILSSCWIFEPNVGTAGAYVTYNQATGTCSNPTASQVNRYLQPGQAFFIKNISGTTPNPVLTFTEADKAVSTANLTSIFGDGANDEPVSKMVFSLHKLADNGLVNMDGTVMCYKSTFTNARGSDDAAKITNGNENLAIYSNASTLSIEGRQQPLVTDTIRLRLWQTVAGTNYILKVDLNDYIANGLQPVLKDRFTQSSIPLQWSVTSYPFVTTGDTTSFNYRFTVVFNNISVLPVTFTGIKAYAKDKGNNIEWASLETNASVYEVQQSLDGRLFNTIGTLNAKNEPAASYLFYHSNPFGGINYYRVKGTDKADKISFSDVVKVNNANTKEATVTIFPNPVKGQVIHVKTENLTKENYQAQVYNSLGQLVYTTVIKNPAEKAEFDLRLPQTVQPGAYTFRLSNEGWSKEKAIIIE